MASNPIPLKLRIHSPTHIGAGDGKVLSPYTDFVLSESGEEMCLIRPRRMNQILKSIEGAGDSLWTKILADKNQSGNRSDFSLRKFLEGHGVDPEEGAIRLRNFGMGDNHRREVMQMEKTAGRPYIPGSSLKGAIRTCILYDWLLNAPKGQAELKQVTARLGALSEAQAEFDYLSRKKKKARLPQHEFATWNRVRDVLKQKKYLLNEEKLFDKIKHGPHSQFFQVSDTSWTHPQQAAVWAMDRIRLAPEKQNGKRQADIPMSREAFLPHTTLGATLSLRPEPNRLSPQSELGYLYKGFPPLGHRIRQFSLACAQRELKSLQSAAAMPDKQARRSLTGFYADLVQQMEQGAIFLRIGGGKTYFDNSLALAIASFLPPGLPAKVARKKRDVHLEQFLHVFAGTRHKFWPVTRVVARAGAEVLPPGWVEITPQEA